VGSLLAGPEDFIEEARYNRKIMGGGMRQAGILAAAGLIALTKQAPLLAEDHRRARKLEQALEEIPEVKVLPGDINMVFFNRPIDFVQAHTISGNFKKQGILINPPEVQPGEGTLLRGLFRFVLHHWIGDGELERIIAVSRSILGGPVSGIIR
jgi:threonine aldolase